jgi:hypothetical protein
LSAANVERAATDPASSPADSPNSGAKAKIMAALPLGGRIKMDPWSDELSMLKAKPVSIVAEREKMPFEVTPFVIYLSREQSGPPAPGPAVSAESKTDIDTPVDSTLTAK